MMAHKAQTRAKRKDAFTGLSKEIIQAELEDDDCHHETFGTETKDKEDNSMKEDERNETTKKRLVQSRKCPQGIKTAPFRAKVSKSLVNKFPSRTQEIGNLKEETFSCDDGGDQVQDQKQNPCPIPDKEKFFCCPKCCVFFRKEEFKEFQSHINEVCAVKKRFPCEHCGHIYTAKSVLIYHIDCVHDKPKPQSKTIRVKPRKEYFSEMSRIYELLQSGDAVSVESTEGEENESILNRKSTLENRLEKIKKELEMDNWPTDQKTAETTGKSSGSWKCWVCFYESKKKSFWLAHMNRIHPDAKGISLNCDYCQFSFTQKHHLREHLNEIHENETGNNCKTCGRKFLHRNSHHACAKISCDICGQSFNTRGSKTKHMITHSEYKPFVCEICPKSFKKREYLSLHLRTHSDSRPYQCDFCSKQFRSKSHYNNHRRIHTGEKPYVCDSCGRSFISPQCLHNHLKSHSKTKNFSCDVCDKTFRTAYDAKRHRVIHTKEKLFQCKICQKRFNRRGNCLAHERKHVEKGFANPFTCHICNEIFDRPRKLDKHLKSVHKSETNNMEKTTDKNVPLCYSSDNKTQTWGASSQLQIVTIPESTLPIYFAMVSSKNI